MPSWSLPVIPRTAQSSRLGARSRSERDKTVNLGNITYKAGGEMEQFLGFRDGLLPTFDIAKLLNAVLQNFDFLST